MNAAPPSGATPGTAAAGSTRRWRPRRPGRLLLTVLAALAVAAGAVVAMANPFTGAGDGGGNAAGNDTPTSLATVVRQSLSSRTQVEGTLGYAGSSIIVLPAGTTSSDLQKARLSVASAQTALHVAEVALAADSQALSDARAMLAAHRRKLAGDCAGRSAAGAGGNSSDSSANPSSASTPCATAAQAVASDEQDVTNAGQKVTTDRGSVASARLTQSGAEQSLATAESSAVVYDTGALYTSLPSPGSVVRRGRALYAISGRPVLLLYGHVTAWRAFRIGMSPGRDVSDLNANLRALGYGAGLGGDSFSAATERAITALQAAHGLMQTGELPLGSVVFKAGPVRVKSVTPTVGASAQAGPVLAVTSVRHQVTVALDAARQYEVKAGDKVTITLPDNRTTQGIVSTVGRVASPGSGGGSPTVDVYVKLADRAAAGRVDHARVQVSITTASVEEALVVPVNALLALAGGGYAVEAVDAAGVHNVVAVTMGLFDDADGLVQVTGAGLHAGQRIVVPAP